MNMNKQKNRENKTAKGEIKKENGKNKKVNDKIKEYYEAESWQFSGCGD